MCGVPGQHFARLNYKGSLLEPSIASTDGEVSMNESC
jgi:hypothetical protein